MAESQPEPTWWNWYRTPKGFGIVLASLLALATVSFGIYDRVTANRAEERPGAASSMSSTPAPSTPRATHNASTSTECFSYVDGGDDEPIAAQQNYSASDFEPVDCLQPHQFEGIPRTAATNCDDAVRELLRLDEVVGFKRTTTAPLGESGCAVGRHKESTLETDTYRITTASDLVSAYGSCIRNEDTELFLSGSVEYTHDVPCQSGRVLPAQWALGDNQSPQELCEDLAVRVRTREVRWAPSTVGEADAPAVRCAFTLWGVGIS